MEFENNEESLYYYSSSSSPSSSSTSSQTQLSPVSTTQHSPPPSSPTSPHTHKRRSGRKKFRETRHPVYRGVRQRNGNKWVCEVREPIKKSRIWLGTYSTPEMAARAHDAAVLALRGTSATFNFPLSVPLLPIAKSSSPQDIREAASKAAQQTNTDITNPPISSSSSSNMNLCVGVDGDEGAVSNSSTAFFDEEAMFNMPALLDSMAEGMLITPPSLKHGAFHLHDDEFQTDLTLWNFD